MAADSKVILFAVVGIVIGAAVGVGIGFAVWHSDVGEQTYWFYIDYGSAADDSHVNGWVSVKATSAADAVKKIPGVHTEPSETYGVSLEGINGVEKTEDWSKYWIQFIRNGEYPGTCTFDKNFEISNFGFGGTYCTVMYLYYAGYGDIPTNEAWVESGPFAK